MLNGAIIIQHARQKKYDGFWFVKPQKEYELNYAKDEKSNQNQSVWKYIIKGIKPYLLYGIPLDLLSLLKKQPNLSIWKKIKNLRFGTTLLLTSYVGIYRVSFLNI